MPIEVFKICKDVCQFISTSHLLMSKASKDECNSISTIHPCDEYFCGQPKVRMCFGGRKLSR
jgi:hypothetical protein